MTKLSIDKIRIDCGTQFRASLNEGKVSEYADMLNETKAWPFDAPCEVFFDGSLYYLVDGFHRYMAATRAKRTAIECNVAEGTLRDAIKSALRANARHGLHRSNEDKRMAVAFALADAEWSKLSSRAIAEICGVSDRFVESNRKTPANRSQVTSTRTGKDGKEYTQPVKPKPEPKKAAAEVVYEDVEVEPEVVESKSEHPKDLSAPIQAVATQLNGMLKQLSKLADDRGGEWLNMQDLETKIDALKFSIRQSIYWVDCMDCSGKG